MADESLLAKVHDLSDLELAVLLCLINREHVLISTPSQALDDLVQELQLVASKTFGLGWVVIHCDASTTLDDFASALLLHDNHNNNHNHHNHNHNHNQRSRADSYLTITSLGSRPPQTPARIANFIIAKNLDRAPRIVQIQALELLRTHRIFTRTAVQTAPKQFVFIPIVAAASGGQARVTNHLNDFFAISHWHDPRDGYVNLEDDDMDTCSSTGSVVKKPSDQLAAPAPALISEADISHLAQLSQQVQVDVDVLRYQMNIISFLRMHRAVASGITPTATKHFHQLLRSLAPLHRLDYVTPALVALAVRKIYLHRIRVTAADKERSLQWGSSLKAVEALLEGVGPEHVMEEVLLMVTAPV